LVSTAQVAARIGVQSTKPLGDRVEAMASGTDRGLQSPQVIASEPLDRVTAEHVDTVVRRIFARELDEAAIAVAAFGSSV
jgi:hypothetical protein